MGAQRMVTDEEIATFQSDGVICLRGLFDTDWIAKLQDAAAYALDHPTEMAIEMAEANDHEGRFFFDTFVWRTNAGCRQFVEESPAASVAGQLMDASKINVLFDQWLIKEPGTETPTPWHHDVPYWPVDGDQLSTLWLALDPVDLAGGAVEYVKGSHRWGQRFFPQTFSGMDGFDEDLPRIPDIDANRDDYDIVHFELEPGDCTVHDGLLVHSAPGNQRTDRRRRAYVTRWAGDDVTFDNRRGAVHMPPLPDLDHGAPLDSELWPVVWQRSPDSPNPSN